MVMNPIDFLISETNIKKKNKEKEILLTLKNVFYFHCYCFSK